MHLKSAHDINYDVKGREDENKKENTMKEASHIYILKISMRRKAEPINMNMCLACQISKWTGFLFVIILLLLMSNINSLTHKYHGSMLNVSEYDWAVSQTAEDEILPAGKGGQVRETVQVWSFTGVRVPEAGRSYAGIEHHRGQTESRISSYPANITTCHNEPEL